MSGILLFLDGKEQNKSLDDFEEIVVTLKKEQDYLHDLRIDDLLDFFDELSKHWLADKEILKEMSYTKALAHFIARKSFAPQLEFALRGDYTVLDTMRKVGDKYYHVQPRGIVVHWLAGNAALLGLYSLFQSLVTKNVSMVKPSVRAYKDFLMLLQTITKVNTKAISGKDLMKCVAVVLIDRHDKELQEKFSEMASVRIAWGGGDAIEAIRDLPRTVHCEDILLGPKYSFGIIDKESFKQAPTIAKKLALDIATFDQYACSSPHTIFIETDNADELEKFGKAVGEALDFVGKKILGKIQPDPKKSMDILTARAKFSMNGKVFASKNTEWTVICSNEEGLAPACASRVITIKRVKSVLDVVPYIHRGHQTLGIALGEKNKGEIINKLTRSGIDRCVPFGDMTFFDAPWDGMFIVDRLVRWVSYY